MFENALCSTVSEMIAHTTQKTKKEAIASIWNPVDSAFKAKFGESFKTSVTSSCHQLGLQAKLTPNEKRDEKRALCRVIRDDMNKQLSASTPTSILVENQSLAMYSRQRLSQYFEQKPAKKRKSHSPSTQNWDTEGLISFLQSAPTGTNIIWQQLAEQFGIIGPNRGQICKEYAMANTSTDFSRFIFMYVSGSTPVRRSRVSRKRLTGGEISCPTPPTCAAVKRKWEEMIERGELSLGIPCVPYNITKVSISEGKLIYSDVPVYGRKVTLLELRKKLLRRHEKSMRLPTDEDVENMSHTSIVSFCKELGIEVSFNSTDDELRTNIKQATRQRYLLFWHDHATILGRGYVLVTVSVIHNHAIFTPGSYQQSFIEEPEVHILGVSSSSPEDQWHLSPKESSVWES